MWLLNGAITNHSWSVLGAHPSSKCHQGEVFCIRGCQPLILIQPSSWAQPCTAVSRWEKMLTSIRGLVVVGFGEIRARKLREIRQHFGGSSHLVPSLKLTFSPLKMDDWKTILSFWGFAYFQGRTVSFREGSVVCDHWFFNPSFNGWDSLLHHHYFWDQHKCKKHHATCAGNQPGFSEKTNHGDGDFPWWSL